MTAEQSGMFICAIIVYMSIAIVTYVAIEKVLFDYANDDEKPIIVIQAKNLAQLHKDVLSLYGAVLFPLYHLFYLGVFVGKLGHAILINNKNENRIVSWFI